MRWN